MAGAGLLVVVIPVSGAKSKAPTARTKTVKPGKRLREPPPIIGERGHQAAAGSGRRTGLAVCREVRPGPVRIRTRRCLPEAHLRHAGDPSQRMHHCSENAVRRVLTAAGKRDERGHWSPEDPAPAECSGLLCNDEGMQRRRDTGATSQFSGIRIGLCCAWRVTKKLGKATCLELPVATASV